LLLLGSSLLLPLLPDSALPLFLHGALPLLLEFALLLHLFIALPLQLEVALPLILNGALPLQPEVALLLRLFIALPLQLEVALPLLPYIALSLLLHLDVPRWQGTATLIKELSAHRIAWPVAIVAVLDQALLLDPAWVAIAGVMALIGRQRRGPGC